MKSLSFLRGWIKRPAKSFRKDEDGVTAVEFGLVAVPYFLLVMGILELGITLGAQYSMNYGVSVASSNIRTGQSQGWSRSQFITEICQSAILLSDCESKVRLDVQSANDFQGLQAASSPNFLDASGSVAPDSSGFSFDMGNRKNPVIVTVAYEWTLVGFLGTLSPLSLGNMSNGNRLIQTTEIFRNEPF